MKLSILAIIRNERDVEEWLQYHRTKGVEHFYLLEHFNEIPIAQHKDVTTVDVTKLTIDQGYPQLLAYRWAFEHLVKSHWCAVIDADEFIVTNSDLHNLLAKYEKYNGLGIHWLCFGNSNHKNRQSNVLDHYTWRTPYDFSWNSHVKSIVKTKSVKQFKDPHYLVNKTVDENFKPLKVDRYDAYTGETIRLNHYWCKSLEDFAFKKKGWIGRKDLASLFTDLNNNCLIEDRNPLKIRRNMSIPLL